jgi:hypothetical protein
MMEVTMHRRTFIRTGSAALAVSGLTLAGFTSTLSDALAGESNSAKRQEIDAKVHATLSRLYETVKGSKELVGSTVSGSFGLQAGAQSKAVIFLFMTHDALSKFRNSKGWSVGGEGSVALLKVGANGAIDTTTATAPVQAIVLTNAGLMGDVSLSGTKVSRLKI